MGRGEAGFVGEDGQPVVRDARARFERMAEVGPGRWRGWAAKRVIRGRRETPFRCYLRDGDGTTNRCRERRVTGAMRLLDGLFSPAIGKPSSSSGLPTLRYEGSRIRDVRIHREHFHARFCRLTRRASHRRLSPSRCARHTWGFKGIGLTRQTESGTGMLGSVPVSEMSR